MSLTDLVSCCVDEMNKYRNKEASNDRYGLEIFRRAVVLRDDGAWSFLQRQFGENARIWFNRHPSRDVALRYDSEQSYVDEAFRRFWLAVSDQQLTFRSDDPAKALEEREGVPVDLYYALDFSAAQNAMPLMTAQIDDLGNVVFKAIPSGEYVMVVQLPEREIVIEGLNIQSA